MFWVLPPQGQIWGHPKNCWADYREEHPNQGLPIPNFAGTHSPSKERRKKREGVKRGEKGGKGKGREEK